jgi:hypothetical protein
MHCYHIHQCNELVKPKCVLLVLVSYVNSMFKLFINITSVNNFTPEVKYQNYSSSGGKLR